MGVGVRGSVLGFIYAHTHVQTYTYTRTLARKYTYTRRHVGTYTHLAVSLAAGLNESGIAIDVDDMCPGTFAQKHSHHLHEADEHVRFMSGWEGRGG